MALTLVTAPAEEPITTAEAKSHLRVDGSDEDTLIGTLITAARQHIDGSDGWLNRALITQTWDLKLDAFPSGSRGNPESAIIIPLPPLQSVTSITYVDEAGVSQTLTENTDYTVDTASVPARIVPAYGKAWPGARDQINAVTIRFVAGYGAAADVPQPVKQAILLLIGHWYETREAVNIGNIVNTLPFAVDALLTPYRVWSL